jgi:hypothetical protein
MLELGQFAERSCHGWSRRSMLRVGALGLPAASLAAPWFNSSPATAAESNRSPRNCIFIYLSGGPSHFETFDPKPNAVDYVRGPFGTISTSLPGVQFCELLPRTARLADRIAVVRSMSHTNAGHDSTAMTTGFDANKTLIGSVVGKLRPSSSVMPPFVNIGSRRGDGTREQTPLDIAGGGSFGAPYEPMVVRDPTGKKVNLGEFSLRSDFPAERFDRRQELLRAVDDVRRAVDDSKDVIQRNENYRRAADLLTSTRVREAFDVGRETDPVRMRYGANFFGQSCLMARRLIEAGTRFVQVKWYDCIAFDAWDVHGAELPGMSRMEQQLCPRFDQGYTALIEDLIQRGLFESTLVVVCGEFGRTPQINKFGARDHWPYCFSAVLAGAGTPAGVFGASDAKGAYPSARGVRPQEFAATVYQRLGIDVINDIRVRPFIQDATPIAELSA